MMVRSFDILRNKALAIKAFFTDVDGSLTDGKVYYSAKGEELKSFSLRDGTGFYLLRKAGITTGLITGENSEIVRRRADKLKITNCYLGVEDKLEQLKKVCNEYNILRSEVAYLGDDLNDYPLLNKVGLFFCPSDACEEIKKKADYICGHRGGDGAFREAAETLLELRDINKVDLLFDRSNLSI